MAYHEHFEDIFWTSDADSSGVEDYDLTVLLLSQLEVFAFSTVAEQVVELLIVDLVVVDVDLERSVLRLYNPVDLAEDLGYRPWDNAIKLLDVMWYYIVPALSAARDNLNHSVRSQHRESLTRARLTIGEDRPVKPFQQLLDRIFRD